MHTCVLVADGRDIYEVLARFTDYPHQETNQETKWDYFGIGGLYEGALLLKEPKLLRRFFGLLPSGQTSRVSVAKKSEIDQEALFADPPAALFFRDQLYECPYFAEGEELQKWHIDFRNYFDEIPDNTTLQIVDAHS